MAVLDSSGIPLSERRFIPNGDPRLTPRLTETCSSFTDHATCPLPRPENVMEIAIEAGEKFIELSSP